MKGILRWKRPASDCSSAQHTPAPDTMLTGNLKLEWELPSRLEGQDIREWVLASGALTLKDGVVHIGRCEHEVAKFSGSFGTRVLEGVISAVESPLGSHKDTELDNNLAQPAQMLLCHHGSRIPLDFETNTIMDLSS